MFSPPSFQITWPNSCYILAKCNGDSDSSPLSSWKLKNRRQNYWNRTRWNQVVIQESIKGSISSFSFFFTRKYSYIYFATHHSFRIHVWMENGKKWTAEIFLRWKMRGLIYDESMVKTVPPPLSSINLSANLTRSFFSLLKNRRNRF